MTPIDLPPIDIQSGYEQRSSGLITKKAQSLIKSPYIHRGVEGSVLPGMIPGPGMFGGPSGPTVPPTIALASNPGYRTGTGTTQTWTSQSLGTEAADRIIICLGAESIVGSHSYNNISIASSNGTIHVQRTSTTGGGGTYCTIAIASRGVTTGTTGTHIHYLTGSADAQTNVGARMTGAPSNTPVSTGSNVATSGSSVSVSVTCETWQRGVAIAHHINSGTGTVTCSWSANCTELSDATGTPDSGFTYEGYSTARINSGGTVTATFSRSGTQQIVYAIWNGS